MVSRWHAGLAGLLLVALSACGPSDNAQKPLPTKPKPAQIAGASSENSPADRLEDAANIDADRIIHADDTPGDWLAHGRTYSEQRFSPLKDINRDTVKQLGVAWEFRTNTVRGLEATPIVSNGIMFVTGSWSKVWALDAKTGRQLWFYDPEVPGQWGRYACCDVVNRGVAVWKGAVYVGTLDGRLVKLDARTGKPIWDINTIDRNRPYTITGAPRIVKGMVLIGNGGAEYGVRGYLTAYDADTGRQLWRFYVVPGDPKLPPEDKAMADAMKTWSDGGTKHKWWEQGGGGTPWDSMAYDPDLDLLYRRHRQRLVVEPQSAFAGRRRQSLSVVDRRAEARDRRTGLVLPDDAGRRLGLHGDAAHHPGRHHDRRRAAQGADAGAEERLLLRHRSHQRKADLGQALHDDHLGQGRRHEDRPADRKSGRALCVDGRRCRFRDRSARTIGSPWRSIPQTGLVYIPVIDEQLHLRAAAHARLHTRRLEHERLRAARPDRSWPASRRARCRRPPRATSAPGIRSAQKMVWQVPMSGGWNSGMLTTAGGLVFGGGSDGIFAAYDAKNGSKLWSIDLKTGMTAPAITYTVDGEQYVAIAAAFGGSGGLGATSDPNTALQKWRNNQGRIFAFKIGGSKNRAGHSARTARRMFRSRPTKRSIRNSRPKGFTLFHQNCAVCHGVLMLSSGEVPDLRMVAPEIWNQYDKIVLDGALADTGMGSFKDLLERKTM